MPQSMATQSRGHATSQDQAIEPGEGSPIVAATEMESDGQASD
jgi:hypothetical protein